MLPLLTGSDGRNMVTWLIVFFKGDMTVEGWFRTGWRVKIGSLFL